MNLQILLTAILSLSFCSSYIHASDSGSQHSVDGSIKQKLSVMIGRAESIINHPGTKTCHPKYQMKILREAEQNADFAMQLMLRENIYDVEVIDLFLLRIKCFAKMFDLTGDKTYDYESAQPSLEKCISLAALAVYRANTDDGACYEHIHKARELLADCPHGPYDLKMFMVRYYVLAADIVEGVDGADIENISFADFLLEQLNNKVLDDKFNTLTIFMLLRASALVGICQENAALFENIFTINRKILLEIFPKHNLIIIKDLADYFLNTRAKQTPTADDKAKCIRYLEKYIDLKKNKAASGNALSAFELEIIEIIRQIISC